MATVISHPREAFPLTPRGGSVPYSEEAPSGPDTRPWVLRFARTPDSVGVVPVPDTYFDEHQQVSLAVGGGLMPCMGTHKATVPDGSITDPPKLDEGPKD
ncbi:putative ATP-grasp-modified RiPP [Streptomyces uncialis]|uniref:putative ATP-grasp-modified RiPP n=1 Tax=Streptomyces uncialis TaxID=1048205 RepID=UPI00380CF334